MEIDEIKCIINKLKDLDQTTYPVDEINSLFKLFRKVAVIDYRLHPGKKIIRGRPRDDQWPYQTRSSLSYKPQDLNTTFQRASTPNKTMFYGSIIPDDLDKGDLDNERFVVTMEALPWIRIPESCGIKEITYSRWEVLKDVKLIAVLHHKSFYDASSHTRKVLADFEESLKSYPEVIEASLMVSEYIAKEFAKEDTPADYSYLISALYTEMITHFGFDGIMYPSVRVGGRGFNIALTPETVDDKLKLIAAGECTIYKKAFGDSVIDNNTFSLISDENMPFEYTTLLGNPESAGEGKCLEELGLTSKKELCLPKP